MFLEIKNKIDQEISDYILGIDRSYGLSSISGLLYKSIKDFISRKGKRVRPLLFVIGYLGFSRKPKPPEGLYRSAVSLELFHDFMLVHDDIIDRSDTRRGEPSMHSKLNKYFAQEKNIKFCGQDLAIVAGDVMYAMAMHAFLSIKEDMARKECALRRLIEAAIYTGSGEFIELMCGAKELDKITKEEIFKIYDLKTANYTFASPLCIGAILAGAKKGELKKLLNYGTHLGRAFQIKDDILGVFGCEAKTGKSNLTDLKESKKTILIWYAHKLSGKKDKLRIKNILSKINIKKNDITAMRGIIINSGALDFAKKEIERLIKKAESINKSLDMRREYKASLNAYSRELLTSNT